LIYELDLDILNTYLDSRNEVSRLRLSRVRVQTGQTDTERTVTDTQTDRRDCTHYHASFVDGNHGQG